MLDVDELVVAPLVWLPVVLPVGGLPAPCGSVAGVVVVGVVVDDGVVVGDVAGVVIVGLVVDGVVLFGLVVGLLDVGLPVGLLGLVAGV